MDSVWLSTVVRGSESVLLLQTMQIPKYSCGLFPMMFPLLQIPQWGLLLYGSPWRPLKGNIINVLQSAFHTFSLDYSQGGSSKGDVHGPTVPVPARPSLSQVCFHGICLDPLRDGRVAD